MILLFIVGLLFVACESVMMSMIRVLWNVKGNKNFVLGVRKVLKRLVFEYLLI